MSLNPSMKKEIRMFICDDNAVFANLIKETAEKAMPSKRSAEILVFDSPKLLLEEWNRTFADAVILDVNMPHMDGFALAEKLQQSKPDVSVIFVTSHENLVFQSYEYHPFWFIRKNHLEELKNVLPKLLTVIDARDEEKRQRFLPNAENCTIELDINTLVYIESFKNDIVIHDRVKEDIRVRCKISDAARQLYPMHVIRIQKSILLNCRYISKVTSREVFMTDGTSFNAGRDRIDDIKDEYQEYIRSRI